MKTEMKTVRILIPILLVFVILSAASPVLATDRLTLNYAATGHIENRDTGESASMSLTLKGTLTLGTPDYESPEWSPYGEGDRGWNNYGGGYDWSFTWVQPYPNEKIPQWVFDKGFTPIPGYEYRVHVDWDNHEHWMDHSHSYYYRWYTLKGSWSGQLVAMWSGGTAPETFSVSLTPWKVEKILTEGYMYMAGDSWRHERWEIYRVNTGDGEQHLFTLDSDPLPLGGGFDYYAESFDIYFNGKFSTKAKRLKGTLWLREDRFWMNPLPSSAPTGMGVQGRGEFGPYSFNFPS